MGRSTGGVSLLGSCALSFEGGGSQAVGRSIKRGAGGVGVAPCSASCPTLPHLFTQVCPFPLPQPSPGRTFPNLEALELDPATLEARAVPPHHITRLYRTLHASAAAFARTVVSEQSRLATLMQGGDAVPLADRLLAYVFGEHAPLRHAPLQPEPDGGDDDMAAAAQQEVAAAAQQEAAVATPGRRGGGGGAAALDSSRPTASSLAAGAVREGAASPRYPLFRLPTPQGSPARSHTSAAAPGGLQETGFGAGGFEEGDDGRPSMVTPYGKGGVEVTEEERAAVLSPEVVMDVDRATELARSGRVCVWRGVGQLKGRVGCMVDELASSGKQDQ